tara:strand:- start:1317 stop:1571 length:255 start_codon:yes stop_codon:yes gene_type:complete
VRQTVTGLVRNAALSLLRRDAYHDEFGQSSADSIAASAFNHRARPLQRHGFADRGCDPRHHAMRRPVSVFMMCRSSTETNLYAL